VLRRPRRRGWWRGWLLLAVAGPAAIVSGEDDTDLGGGGGRPVVLRAEVLEVTDGDTIVVRLRGGGMERVRYIGVDTPESTPEQPLECFGHEAAERNRELVGGETVRLELGRERRDDYGRLLAYVRTRDAFVNARLLEGGYARVLTIAPNDARARLFGRIEAEAGRDGRGLWGSCENPSANLSEP
jgi:micrococcal nuclease